MIEAHHFQRPPLHMAASAEARRNTAIKRCALVTKTGLWRITTPEDIMAVYLWLGLLSKYTALPDIGRLQSLLHACSAADFGKFCGARWHLQQDERPVDRLCAA